MIDRIARLEVLARAGYGARSVVYLLVGWFLITTRRGEGSASVMGHLSEGPAGAILLVAIGLGLAGYGLFRLYSAWQDLDGESGSAMGKMKRFGKALSGATHLLLAASAAALAIGVSGGGGDPEREAARGAFELPGGAALVAIVGVGVIVAGLGNLLEAWACSFRKALDARTPGWAVIAGRAGYAARGLVFLLVGWQVISLAIGWDDGRIGMEQAMAGLRDRDWLFLTVAAGLAAFGLFSGVMALYARIRDENVLARLKQAVRR